MLSSSRRLVSPTLLRTTLSSTSTLSRRILSPSLSLPFTHSVRFSSSTPSLSTPSPTKKKPFFITTPIYYVNGEPHLGHAYTSVLADVIARYNRHLGRDVHLLSGTDEHGQKVEQSAIQAGQSPIKFATMNSAKFRHLMFRLNCSVDDFIRTTEDRHRDGVLALWQKLESDGWIYKGAYEGWYSIRDEAFYSDNELVAGRAPTGAEVTWVKEESYFFRLSAFTDRLLKFYEEDNPTFIAPSGRKKEVIAFLKQEGGLRDLSISRTTFSWGIPVPGDPKHVVYVWLDALTNYISALGYPNTDSDKFKTYWPASVHIVGKDILRFHAVFWPAFLMAAGLEPPKKVFAHGWWTKDGEKMSKSLGNVIDPHDLLDVYGVDYVRYFLTSEIHFGNDGDFSHDAFANKINTDLSNDLGNLLQRALTFIHKHCDGRVPSPSGSLSPCLEGPEGLHVQDKELLDIARNMGVKITQQLDDEQNMKGICDNVISLAKLGNRYIDAQAPWSLVKQNQKARMYTVLYVLIDLLRITAIYLHPIMPQASGAMMDQMGLPLDMRTFDSIAMPLPSGFAVGQPSPVFPKIDLSNPQHQSHAQTPLQSVNTTPKKRGTGASPQEIENMMRKVHGKYVDSMKTVTNEELMKMIHEVGEHIRQLKLEKVSKSSLEPFILELKYLKEKYQELFGTVNSSSTVIGSEEADIAKKVSVKASA